jgi:hypothetical protein
MADNKSREALPPLLHEDLADNKSREALPPLLHEDLADTPTIYNFVEVCYSYKDSLYDAIQCDSLSGRINLEITNLRYRELHDGWDNSHQCGIWCQYDDILRIVVNNMYIDYNSIVYVSLRRWSTKCYVSYIECQDQHFIIGIAYDSNCPDPATISELDISFDFKIL